MLLLKGLNLMVVGMTTVFVFLGLLVLTMHALTWMVNRFAPPAPAEPPTPPDEEDDEIEIAVILAAVEAYRSGGAQPATRG